MPSPGSPLRRSCLELGERSCPFRGFTYGKFGGNMGIYYIRLTRGAFRE